ELNRLHSRIFQNFPDRHPVTAAKHQDPFWMRNRGKSRLNERFVIPIFIARAKLKVRVEKQANVVFLASNENPLIRCGLGENRLSGKYTGLRECLEPVGRRKSNN